MPIITIEIVADSPLSPTLIANSIGDRVGEIFGSDDGPTWVKVVRIAKGDYAVSGVDPTDCPHPVFVYVIRPKLPAETEIQIEIDALTESIAEICNRDPKNIHVIYEPDGRGRVALGGKLIT